jgi:hypothetical protein
MITVCCYCHRIKEGRCECGSTRLYVASQGRVCCADCQTFVPFGSVSHGCCDACQGKAVADANSFRRTIGFPWREVLTAIALGFVVALGSCAMWVFTR